MKNMDNKINVNVVNNSSNSLPAYATSDSAGLDLRADLETDSVIIPAGERMLIKTNIKVAIPSGYACFICPRSGLALKNGITVLNAPGVIDADYRDGIGVILANLSKQNFEVKNHDRIAQAVFIPYTQVMWNEVEQLDETERKGGFGSTGVK